MSGLVRAVLLRASCLALMLAGFPVDAATPTPGTVISPIDKPVHQPERTTLPPIEQKKKPAFESPASAKKITIHEFVIRGNSIYSSEHLLALIGDYRGSQMSLAEIYQVADVIQDYYRSNGYLLASVFLPAQKVSSGSVRLEVVEGRMSRALVEGPLQSYQRSFLLQQLDELSLGAIIEKDALESETLLLNELPGLEARAIIERGDQPGTSNVVMKVEEDRGSGTVRLNNYGRESIGEFRLEGGWLYANPFMQGDMLNLSAIVSDGSQMLYGRVDYDALVNTAGTRTGFSISTFNYEVDVVDLGLPSGQTLDGDGTNLSIRVIHPMQRSRRSSIDLGAIVRRNETDEGGSLAAVPENSINVLDLLASWQLLHGNNSQSMMSAMLSTNFKSNDDGLKDDAEKARLTLDYSYTLPFAESWFMLLRANLVASVDPLPDVERYRIGGPDNVRAYPSAELAGDGGGFASIDVGRSFVQKGGFIYSARVFVDAGKVTQKSRPGVTTPPDESLAGYGIGFAASYKEQHHFELQVVEPSNDDRITSDGRDTRAWVSYTAQL